MSLLDDLLNWLREEDEKLPREGRLAALAGRIIASLPFPLILCNQDLSVLAANRLLARFLKRDEAEIEGKQLGDLLGGAVGFLDREERPLVDLKAILTKRNPKMLVGLFPGARQKVFHLYSRKISGAGNKVFLLVLQDITGMKELEIMNSKSRHELLSIFDGVEDPMVLIDKNLRIRRINQQMLTTLGGKSYLEFIGNACFFKLHGLNDICPGCSATESLQSGRKTSRTGLLQKRPNADEFSYQITCYPTRDQRGEITGVAECYRDMTEVTDIREALYESERNRVMESFAAGIAHEVKNPLAVIQSNAQFCLSQMAQEEEGDFRESLEAIVRSVQVANRVIHGLMDFAQPQEVCFEQQALEPILKEGLSLIRGRAKSQAIKLKTSIQSGLPRLVVDRKRFLQAYLNFLLNSLDAMPKGGKISVKASGSRRERKVEIIISDTGQGVPEEVVPKVFQPFYSMKKDGLGLGLPIAEGIIRSHGGHVTFKSWLGMGSEIRIDLPTTPSLLTGNKSS